MINIVIGLIVSTFLLNTGRALKATELFKECLIVLEVRGQTGLLVKLFEISYEKAFNAYRFTDYTSAIKYGRKLLDIYHESGERTKEGHLIVALAAVYERQCKFAEAKELYERAINIMRQLDDRKGEALAYGELAFMYCKLSEYAKAKEYQEKALMIRIEIGDREGEAISYGNLATMNRFIAEYDKAEEYLGKALAIDKETGNRAGEAKSYGNLGNVFQSRGDYGKATEYYEKSLAIEREIGDRAEEAASYGALGTVCHFRGEYDKAKEYLEKALVMREEIGNRRGEAEDRGNLGNVFHSLGEYDKAKEHYEKALTIRIEIGDRKGEASSYGSLGTLFQAVGEYVKAKEHLDKALAIRTEIGDRTGEAANYQHLGAISCSLGEYSEAKEYFKKALAIRIEIGDRAGEAADYGNLGHVSQSLGEYDKAKEYLEKALKIRIKIEDKVGKKADYSNLGAVSQSLGEYYKAKEYFEKALAIAVEVGGKESEATCYGNLGGLFIFLGEHVKAEDYLKKAISISKDIGDLHKEFVFLSKISGLKLLQGKMMEARDYLTLSIKVSEDLYGFLKGNDQFKISFLDTTNFPYQTLSQLMCVSGNPKDALYVLELARARALAELMATQYSVEKQITADPQSWIGIENIMKKESDCVCLYISSFLGLWILKPSGIIHFRSITENINSGVVVIGNLTDFFDKSFRSFGILPEENCEDRSIGTVTKPKSFHEEDLEALRLVEDDDQESQNLGSNVSSLCYRMLIDPVADLLVEPEIIIVPDPSLRHIPFAALTDEGGKYLSETFRIRIVPSLTTLKLIQDSPADYHSQTGALIVGDPVVGRVRYKGRRKNFLPLPCARKEAEMIGKLLGVHPLLGQCATKQAVLKSLHSVSLIHFAAHGDAERGEIALSPLRSTKKIPREEDYLLTMSDISQVQLRAKLVVLSCCHSGCGQIRAEGVIGIARAFLGSGARSVLVALWAIEDRATEQLMRRFYEHLVRGKSASESLHEAMKWMRSNGFTDISEWAPFMLIGDNVTFDFGK